MLETSARRPDGCGTSCMCVHVMDADGMLALGRAFGDLYLKPLLNSGPAECRGLAVTAYGSLRSGKSTFIRGCSERLLADEAVWAFQRAVHGPTTVGNHLFRHRDFGPWGYVDPSVLREPSNTSGVDFMEHPPLSRVTAQGVAIAVTNLDHAGAAAQRFYHGYVVGTRLDNVGAGAGGHHGAVRDFLAEQFGFSAHDKSSLIGAASRALMRAGFAAVARKMTPPRVCRVGSLPGSGRMVGILRIGNHPLAAEAFRNLKEHIRRACHPGVMDMTS